MVEVRCCQSCDGRLWVGKRRKSNKLSKELPQIDIDNIKRVLGKVRKENIGGAFWINMNEGYILVMKEGEKTRGPDTPYYSIRRKGIVYEGKESEVI